jgi:membrane protease YdiL (CAAX protease family)
LEKFAGEALLTFVVAGLLAIVLVPLAFLLNWNTPRTPIRGVPERWPGLYLAVGSLLVAFCLPSSFAELGSRFGMFRFLDSSADPTVLLRPTVSTTSAAEWTQITNSLRNTYAAVASLPLVLLVIWFLKKRSIVVAARVAPPRSPWNVLVYEIILCWAVYGFLAICLNIALQYLYLLSGWKPTIHPIAKLGLFDGTGGWMIGLGACVIAPFTEELIFRRWLLPWAMRRRVRNLWLQLFALYFSVSAFVVVQRFEVLLFGLFLFVMQAIVFVYPEQLRKVHRLFRSTTFAANWATSSVFAMMHASVWPSPVALMVLSMGLGFLVVRTGRWWTAVLCHSLFNFTSLMVLYASQGALGAMYKIAVT